ncbi:hypothetical protein EXS74_02620 [Candidatus Woesearchaeota archaeon]|nr:hypothetical protein [Candidatus Woesearchaeota archaeon]
MEAQTLDAKLTDDPFWSVDSRARKLILSARLVDKKAYDSTYSSRSIETNKDLVELYIRGIEKWNSVPEISQLTKECDPFVLMGYDYSSVAFGILERYLFDHGFISIRHYRDRSAQLLF